MENHLRGIVEAYEREEVVNYYVAGWFNPGLRPTEEALIEKYFPKGGRILNVGCGAGRETFPLAEKGFEVVAIDITPKLLFFARKRNEELGQKVEFVLCDACHLPFRDGSFNSYYMTPVMLQYISGRQNRIRLLREAKRVLRPNGTCLVSFLHLEFASLSLLLRAFRRGIAEPETGGQGSGIGREKAKGGESQKLGDLVQKVKKGLKIAWTESTFGIWFEVYWFFANLYRRGRRRWLKEKHQGPEVGDYRYIVRAGRHREELEWVFYHYYTPRESLEDVKQAGFNVLEIVTMKEFEDKFFLSALRKGVYRFYVLI